MNEEFFTDGAGKRRTIITKKTLYQDEAGRKYIVGIIQDITERSRMEEEFRRHTKDLEIFYKASIGREERILGLKEEIRQMKAEYERLKKGA